MGELYCVAVLDPKMSWSCCACPGAAYKCTEEYVSKCVDKRTNKSLVE